MTTTTEKPRPAAGPSPAPRSLAAAENAFLAFARRAGLPALRVSLAITFLWFGARFWPWSPSRTSPSRTATR